MIPTHKDLKQSKWYKNNGHYWLYNDKEESLLIGHAFYRKDKTLVIAMVMDTNLKTQKFFDAKLTKKEIIKEWELLMDEALIKLFK